MNAVIEHAPQPTVALLGPADDARAQLRQALQLLGAELVFEGELREADQLQSGGVLPNVVLVNLEPGVEDELDALQELLDHPEVSVVFNEGEVSSRLSGWDLARWARHLAAKVLGIRDTLPPPPQGAERLPVLDLMPEPGRPATPAQQQEHLRFDDYADEALSLQDRVPASRRLDESPSELTTSTVQMPQAVAPAPAADGFDFDFSPIAAESTHEPEGVLSEQAVTQAVPESGQPEVDLEEIDLESVFGEGLEQLTPDDLLLKLQAAMGLDVRLPPQPAPEHQAAAARAASDSAAEAAQLALESFDFDVDAPNQPPSSPAATDIGGFSFDPVDAEFGDADIASESLEYEHRPELSDRSNPDAERVDTFVDGASAFGSPATADSTLDVEDAQSLSPLASDAAEAGALDTGEIGESESSELDALDFSSFQVAETVEFGSANDAALGGTLTFEADSDDEEVARLAAALDEADALLPSAAELDPLDFRHLREDAASARETPPAAAPAPAATARATSGFGDLSLAPLESEPLVLPQAPAAPAPSFDFNGIALSLEPLEGEEIAPEPLRELPPALAEVSSGDASSYASTPSPSDLPEAVSEDEGAGAAAAAAAAPDSEPAMAAVAAAAPVGVSRVVVLCASIGGPDAVRGFLDGLPSAFPALFLVVQHLESGYFERLAQQLQKASKLPVRVPIAGTAARDGEVLVVSSDTRLLVAPDGAIELEPLASASRYRPCIDDVLRDVADTFGSRAVAVIFSGMAADAVEGAVYLTQRGGEVWAQDPESCVVSSMVDGARARGVVEFVGSPRELAAHCMRRLRF
ncbi:MAG: chemotaxis protein CheB [Aquimonas sp.]|nr:chemotaxis protein CheB [Aquimonas sp.]